MELKQKFDDQVACLSVSLDYNGFDVEKPEEAREDVMAVLEKVGARFQNFISADMDEEFYEKSQTTSVPTVLIYDQSGKLHKQVDATATGGEEVRYEEHIVPIVEKLLARG